MSKRSIVRVHFVLAFSLAALFAPPRIAAAQTPTDAVISCLDESANDFKKCVDDLAWYAEALCYARYAADGVLCLPGGIISGIS